MNIKNILIGSLVSCLMLGPAIASEKQCVVILVAEQKSPEGKTETVPLPDPTKLCGCIYTQSTANSEVQTEIIMSDGLPKKPKRTEALNKIIADCQKTQKTK